MKEAIESIPIERRSCNITSFLKNVLEPLRMQAEGFDINLSLVFVSNVPKSILVDAEKIGWIVASTVGNAFRYVRHGTRNLPGGSIQVKVGFDPIRQYLLVWICDDGRGMEPAKTEKVFQKNNDDQPIVGLALKLANDILRAHHGSIKLDSQTGGDQQGTTVYFEVHAPTI